MTKEKKKDKKKDDYILKHRYNPKFELLNDKEAKNILEKYNVNFLQMPKISVKDPVCKLFKAKPNDVFKITRESYTAGKSVFYRVVVNA